MADDLHRVVSVLCAADVAVTALKGMHTAAVYFPDPGTRPSADIDLLIPADAERRASLAMRRAGYELALRERRPPKTEWRPPGVSPAPRSLDLSHADNPWTVEIHTSLERNFFGVRTLRLPGPVEPAPPAVDASVAVLTQPALLAFLAVHAAHELHRLPLLRIVELVLVARADVVANRLDWDAMLRVLDRARATRFAFPPLELAERLAPGTLPTHVRRRLADAATPALRRRVERLSPGTAQRLDRWILAERFMWASGPWESLRCAAHLVWPLAHGRPLRQLPGIYVKRLFRVFRGRASLGPEGPREPPQSQAPPFAGGRE